MDILAIAIQLIAGVIGGNAAGLASKTTTLGTTGNSIAGGIGGLVLSQVIPLLLGHGVLATSGVDLASIATNLSTGTIAGAATAVIVGYIKTKMAKA